MDRKHVRSGSGFLTRRDAGITKGIYRRVPVLVNETTGENP